MDDQRYRKLVRLAIILVAAWAAWSLYQLASGPDDPTARALSAAHRQLQDGHYLQALEQYRSIAEQNSDSLPALRGVSQSLTQLAIRSQEQRNEQLKQARQILDRVIARESNDKLRGIDLANRGIVRDWLGDYAGALEDYHQALQLEPRTGEGPGFFTRFLRNQAKQQATVEKRAAYLEQQLALPQAERQLRKVEADAEQRAYDL